MTARDRTVLMIVGVVVLVAATWMLALKPKRDELNALDGKIVVAQQRLDTATSAAATAQQAKVRYDADYATVARLGKAVPVDDDTPSLVYQLEHAADRAHVDFRSIALSASGGSTPASTNSTPAGQTAAVAAADKAGGTSTTTTSSSDTPPPATTFAPTSAPTQIAAATLPPGASVGPAGFATMPFDFAFSGGFFRLESFLSELDKFTRIADSGAITVRGRLLTVDGIALSADPQDFPRMTANIHATAYLLPQSQGLTNGATPVGPAASTATPASTSATPASPTPTAVVGAGR